MDTLVWTLPNGQSNMGKPYNIVGDVESLNHRKLQVSASPAVIKMQICGM